MRTLLCSLLLVVAGCSPFKDEQQEFHYLYNTPNLTPRQYLRMEELADRPPPPGAGRGSTMYEVELRKDNGLDR